MHAALSVSRTHNPKSHITGLYDPEADTTIIEQAAGQHFKTIGKADAKNRLHLLPEEALYMVERGSLDLRWSNVEELEGLPLSLQAAYTYLLGSQGLTLERYTVYSGLKRSGYTVFRSPSWYPEDHDKNWVPPRKPPEPPPLGVFARLYTSLFPNTSPSPVLAPDGPLVQPGLYRSYAPIYRQLALLPFHDPSLPIVREQNLPMPTSSAHPKIRPTFTVWKPSNTKFKKSAPPPPDFHIAVVNAREDPFPAYEQLDELLQCVPYDPPSEGGQVYGRLRQGYRNVIVAVVDQGVTSFVRVGDAGFGMERVWERKSGRGGKGGGRGGRGRGKGGQVGRGGRGGRGAGR